MPLPGFQQRREVLGLQGVEFHGGEFEVEAVAVDVDGSVAGASVEIEGVELPGEADFGFAAEVGGGVHAVGGASVEVVAVAAFSAADGAEREEFDSGCGHAIDGFVEREGF